MLKLRLKNILEKVNGQEDDENFFKEKIDFNKSYKFSIWGFHVRRVKFFWLL